MLDSPGENGTFSRNSVLTEMCHLLSRETLIFTGNRFITKKNLKWKCRIRLARMALFHKILFYRKCAIYRVEQLCFWQKIDLSPKNCLIWKCRIRLARMALFHKILFYRKCAIYRVEQLCFWQKIDLSPKNRLNWKCRIRLARMALFQKNLFYQKFAIFRVE